MTARAPALRAPKPVPGGAVQFGNRGRKYGARRTEYNGRTYDSAAEARHAVELDLLCKAGKIVGWIPQAVKRIEVNGVLVCKLILDFEIKLALGRYYYDEVKGMETPIYRLKLKLLKACYPGIDVRVIKA